MTKNKTVLVADDDSSIRTVVNTALVAEGYKVLSTGDVGTLMHWVQDGRGDALICDVMMPKHNMLDFLPKMRQMRPNLKVVVMSANNTVLTALRAEQEGAYDYLPKPFDLDQLVGVTNRAVSEGSAQQPAPRQQETTPSPQANDETTRLPMIGRSTVMQDIYKIVARLAQTDLTVLVSGESGTGKERIARILHDYGPRRQKPFVALNMAAVPADLIESELFGHEKGAFTGALHRSEGRFSQAQGGTLFLDEIGDMPAEAQTRLLRVLQEGEFTTVGGRTAIKTNTRIIAATHQNLQKLVQQGTFREDLYYRLNVVPIKLPPLRQRVDDIDELVHYFLKQAAQEGLPRRTFGEDAIAFLKSHVWPGNVRELENFVKRVVVLVNHQTIGVSDIKPILTGQVVSLAGTRTEDADSLSGDIERHLRAYFAAHEGKLPPVGLYDRLLAEFERPLLKVTLEATDGNQLKAAELLGINRNTFRKKIRLHNLNPRKLRRKSPA